MLLTALLSLMLSPATGPLDAALAATEAPKTLRAAFKVTLSSDEATRVFAYDPRWPRANRWRLESADGDDSLLDEVAAAWGADPAPDGRLFPDDLRASLPDRVQGQDLGGAWRIEFRHRPSANDGELDRWAIGRLDATAWLDPAQERFLRIDHELSAPTPGPNGGTLTAYRQTHYLETEPKWGLTYIARMEIDLEARAAWRTLDRSYAMQVTEIEVFFANAAAEQAYLAARASTDS